MVFDCEKKKVIEYQLSHSQQIQSIRWVKGKKDTFITCSTDGMAIVWNHLNDKWTPKILDISSKISLYDVHLMKGAW